MLVNHSFWPIVVAIVVGLGVWVLAPVVSSTGEYILDGYKEVQVYLEEHIEVQECMGESTCPDSSFMRKGGEIR